MIGNVVKIVDGNASRKNEKTISFFSLVSTGRAAAPTVAVDIQSTRRGGTDVSERIKCTAVLHVMHVSVCARECMLVSM